MGFRCPSGTFIRATHAPFEDDKIGSRTLRNSNDTEICASSTVGVATVDLVDLMFARVDRAGKTIAFTITNHLHTPCRHLVAERGSWLEIDRIPC